MTEKEINEQIEIHKTNIEELFNTSITYRSISTADKYSDSEYLFCDNDYFYKTAYFLSDIKIKRSEYNEMETLIINNNKDIYADAKIPLVNDKTFDSSIDTVFEDYTYDNWMSFFNYCKLEGIIPDSAQILEKDSIIYYKMPKVKNVAPSESIQGIEAFFPIIESYDKNNSFFNWNISMINIFQNVGILNDKIVLVDLVYLTHCIFNTTSYNEYVLYLLNKDITSTKISTTKSMSDFKYVFGDF